MVKRFVYLNALLRPWRYHDTVERAVDWWIAGAALFGGTCFTIGGFAASSQLPTVPKAGLSTAYNVLVYLTFCIGSYWFTMGCTLLTISAVNTDYTKLMDEWAVCGGPKPRYRWLGVRIHSLPYWAGIVYTAGAVLYNIGCTTNLCDQFESVYLSPAAEFWMETITFLVGGVGFLAAGFMYCVDRDGLWFIRGLFLPTRRADLVSLGWWINWFNWWGGVGFFMSGVFLYYYPSLSTEVYKIENAFGFGVGSFCFFMGGLLLYVQMSLAEKHSTSLHTALPYMAAELSMSDRSSLRGSSPVRLRGSSPTYGGNSADFWPYSDSAAVHGGAVRV